MSTIIKVRITLNEEMLGTKPADPEIFKTYIASKHPKGTPERDEIESADRAEIGGTTGFHRDEHGNPIVYDYQIRGFFKEACGALRRVDDSLSAGISSYKTIIDTLVFVYPRKIVINTPSPIGICERPLRAETMQGPRVALARSETVPMHSTMEFSVRALNPTITDKKKIKIPVGNLINEWLSYGALHGFGQWRNSGKGIFSYEILA